MATVGQIIAENTILREGDNYFIDENGVAIKAREREKLDAHEKFYLARSAFGVIYDGYTRLSDACIANVFRRMYDRGTMVYSYHMMIHRDSDAGVRRCYQGSAMQEALTEMRRVHSSGEAVPASNWKASS